MSRSSPMATTRSARSAGPLARAERHQGRHRRAAHQRRRAPRRWRRWPRSARGSRSPTLLPTSDAFNDAHSAAALHGAAPFTKGDKPAFHTPLDNFAKLRLWQLTDYERVRLPRRRHAGAEEHRPAVRLPRILRRAQPLRDARRLSPPEFGRLRRRGPSEDDLRCACLPGWMRRTPSGQRTDQTFLESFFPDWHGLPVDLQHASIRLFQPAGTVGLAEHFASCTISMKSHGRPIIPRPPGWGR